MAKTEKSDKTASAFVPANAHDVETLRDAAARCRGCELYEKATQVVFGAGREQARVMLVGEQPGDVEDRRGEPFVGPAGRLLHRVLEDIGIDQRELYFTNAVKHFRFEESEKGPTKRLHKKPGRSHVVACNPWLLKEIEVVRPRVLVCLGATAAQALLGPDFRVTESRGQLIPSTLADYVFATVHPSSLLRAPDDRRERERELFAQDLRMIPSLLEN